MIPASKTGCELPHSLGTFWSRVWLQSLSRLQLCTWIQTGVFPKSEEVQSQDFGSSPQLIQTKLPSRFSVRMSQKGSAADEVSTLCHHHARSGSQRGPDSGVHIAVPPATGRAFGASRTLLWAQHPHREQCILEGGWFSPLKHLDFIQISTHKL